MHIDSMNSQHSQYRYTSDEDETGNYAGAGDNTDKYAGQDIQRYTFPHRKVCNCGKNADEGQTVLTKAADISDEEMQFSSMADYEDFLIWGTDYKDQFF